MSTPDTSPAASQTTAPGISEAEEIHLREVTVVDRKAPTMFAFLTLGLALIVLFAIDLGHRLLPNVITLPGIAIGFVFSLFSDPGWRSSLAGIVLGGGVPFAVAEIYYRVRGQEGIGMGDVKMLAMIGAFLGFPAAIMTLMLASIAGSIVGLAIILLRRGGFIL